ncbi:MAG: aminoacyl-tRNA hydrolase [Spirochaetota bacterium]
MLRLIVGLGNPGRKYINTRHNVGFDVIDRLSDNYNFKLNSTGFKGVYYKGQILDNPVMFLKPMTYMNLSGISVSQAVNMYKLPVDRLLVIYDDMDLPLGKLRIRSKGSSGGHNGMKSIMESLGNTKEIPRMRIGIGRTPDDDTPIGNTINYVLSDFSKSESEIINKVIDKACIAIEELIKSDDIVKVMNEFNSNEIV